MPLEVGRVGFWVSSRLFPDDGGEEAARVAGELEAFGIPALWLGGASPNLAAATSPLTSCGRYSCFACSSSDASSAELARMAEEKNGPS